MTTENQEDNHTDPEIQGFRSALDNWEEGQCSSFYIFLQVLQMKTPAREL